MRIGVDGNEANITDRVGSGMYAFQLLKHMYELDTWNEYTVYLKAAPVLDMPRERKGWKYKVIGPEKLWTQFALPLHLLWDANHLDIFFTPGHYAPRFSPIPTVVSVLDLAYLKFPEYFKKSDLMQLHPVFPIATVEHIAELMANIYQEEYETLVNLKVSKLQFYSLFIFKGTSLRQDLFQFCEVEWVSRPHLEDYVWLNTECPNIVKWRFHQYLHSHPIQVVNVMPMVASDTVYPWRL
jgi:hypothetical protein